MVIFYPSSMRIIVCEAMYTSIADAKSACQLLSHVIQLFQRLCATAYTRKAILLQVLAMSNLHGIANIIIFLCSDVIVMALHAIFMWSGAE